MQSYTKYRALRIRIGDKAGEIARSSGIHQSTFSGFENGSVELSDAQIRALNAALFTAIHRRMKNLQDCVHILADIEGTSQNKIMEMLTENESENKVAADGAGAPANGQKGRSRCEERNDAR